MTNRRQPGAKAFKHLFVTEVPPTRHLESDTLYVSIPYATTVHLCACGCGHEVVNALSPTDWQVNFDGETVTLNPSVNNSSLACASHYWIDHDWIWWGKPVPAERVAALRAADHRAKSRFYGHTEPDADLPAATAPVARRSLTSRLAFWRH
jgi:hypothetical protein